MLKTKGKRVLMLLENCSYPADDRVRHEAATLMSGGYHITLISPADPGQKWHEDVGGVDVYRFPAPPSAGGLIGYAWEYGYSMVAIFIYSLYIFMRFGFDIVHAAHPPDTFVFICAFYRLFGKPYVLDHHDLAPELYYYARFRGQGNRRLYDLLVWLETTSFHQADLVIATNESYKKIATERGGVDPERITIVRNGPDMKELSNTEVDPEFRKPGRSVIGYVGVTGVQDGVDNLLRALHTLVYEMKRTDFICVIVGSGAALPGLKVLAKELNLDDYVTFTGWVNGHDLVARYLNSMDVCAAPEPSDQYNDRSTAAKVMEYMAMGKPVVSFSLPEHRFTAGAAAVYAKPGDIREYAQLLVSLMDDPEQRQKMGQAGRERIASELVWPHQAERLLEGYARLLPLGTRS